MISLSDFSAIFRESFPGADVRWTDWFLSSVVRPEEIMAVSGEDGRAASAMLLSPYPMDFHGSQLNTAYISCVGTLRSQRGRGLMSQLMRQALPRARQAGYVFAELIPANRHLYFLYDRFGFSTLFYIDEQRYTALHSFESGDFAPCQPDWATFSRLESQRPGAILHSRERFGQIMADIDLDEGYTLAVSSPGGDAAILFATTTDTEAHVLDLLASSPEASEAVLGQLRQQIGEKSIIVKGVPAGRHAALRARAMGRILDAQAILSALAASHPEIDQTIRIHDPIIEENCATFRLHKGLCRKTEAAPVRLSLDVSIDVLGRLLFSTPAIGDIFSLPTARPFISLMLD